MQSVILQNLLGRFCPRTIVTILRIADQIVQITGHLGGKDIITFHHFSVVFERLRYQLIIP